MDNTFFEAIFKRKSFHLFRNIEKTDLTDEELNEIYEAYNSLDSLYPDIKTDIRIVRCEDVGFKRGADYCILFYSEEKDNYLMNIGYLGEQLDLYLVKRNIAALWFGIGKPDIEKYNGMEFVIMIAISKVNDEKLFRKDMFKSKRKPIDEIWSGDILEISDIVRFAPSACNSQPWYVKNDGNRLKIYRYKKEGKRGIMPKDKVNYYNRIDMGIFLCFMDICLEHYGYLYYKKLFTDTLEKDDEYTPAAEYEYKKIAA